MALPTDGLLSVTELNQYLRMKLDNDLILQDVWVRGEISNFSAPSSGHLYFTLKDPTAQVRCVMFRFHTGKLAFSPEAGMKVLLHGKVSVYPEGGQYQIYADEMQPDGAGAMALRFEQLKRKLESEGLFDPSRKKPIPKMPKKIGVVTSPTGAAVQDIRKILGRRFPLAEMILYPAQVQGAEAPEQLISGILFFAEFFPVDVIIIGRGGGSAEDLWAFNDEMLARTVAGCPIPVISAVGHEVDFTICDFVADLRAATPSAAAEIAVPDRAELLSALQGVRLHLDQLERQNLTSLKQELDRIRQSRVFRKPEELFYGVNERLGQAEVRLQNAVLRRNELAKAKLAKVCGALDALNPLGVLKRGYAVVKRGENPVVSAKDTKVGEELLVKFSDGEISVLVEEKC